MYKVYFTHHGYFAGRTFSTVEEALEYGRSVCFQIFVSGPNGIEASWCPLAGTTYYNK